MSAVAPPQRVDAVRDALKPFLTMPVLLGVGALLLLYGPTVWGLAHGLWQVDAHSHGPLVLAVSVWLFIRGLVAHDREGVLAEPKRLAGGLVFGIGLVMYALGRSQSVAVLEVGSAIPVVLGAVLLTRGPALARRLWFAFVFLLFLVPLPGSLVDVITQPMKLGVSWAVESLLYSMGYPIGRSGVVLGIGPYQLFVADACAGLNSLFMLEAFGLLYLNVVRLESALRNAALAVLIVPISFISNVVRVAILALVTYHFGDEAGQGFVHGFSGMVLFVVALMLTMAADGGVRAAMSLRHAPLADSHATVTAKSSRPLIGAAASPRPHARLGRQQTPQGVAVLTAAMAAAFATWAITPPPLAPAAAPDLEAAIPTQFGDWKRVDLPAFTVDVVPRNAGSKEIDRPYDGVMMRAYANSRGEIVALAVAYAADQRQEVKIHRPELCYPAQGFRIVDESSVELLGDASGSAASPFVGGASRSTALPGKRLHVQNMHSDQAVTYLIRIGANYPQSAWALRREVFLNTLLRRTTDGLLLRASSKVPIEGSVGESYAIHDSFLSAMVAAMSINARRIIFGTATDEDSQHQPVRLTLRYNPVNIPRHAAP